MVFYGHIVLTFLVQDTQGSTLGIAVKCLDSNRSIYSPRSIQNGTVIDETDYEDAIFTFQPVDGYQLMSIEVSNVTSSIATNKLAIISSNQIQTQMEIKAANTLRGTVTLKYAPTRSDIPVTIKAVAAVPITVTVR